MEPTQSDESKEQQSAPWYIGLHDSSLMVSGDDENPCAEGLRLAQTANVWLISRSKGKSS